ncbi:S-adenosyl-L-methionine-dependent methyltransferase [Backusella circina FSU 941]|nr:S-adenosyl-L-methionine-dependent methyltransferase [Backusella circina FSU 941]
MADRARSICTNSEYAPSEADPQDQTWDDWTGEDEEELSQCLFCSETFPDLLDAFKHIKNTHNFDFQKTRKTLGLDFYQCIRLINYIRTQVKANPELTTWTETLNGKEGFWEEDQYLQPVLENDTLLFGFEELEEEEVEEVVTAEPTTALEKHLYKLLQIAQENAINLQGQFGDYKETVKKTFYDTLADKNKENETSASGAIVDQGNYYFNSYAQNDIHQEMLKDRARTEAYRDFIYENKDIFKGKVVLDVGCGTGILSMFAAKAGAAQVFSVDNSNIIEKAKLNIKENGLDHIITCVRGKVEEIELPVKQVDIIVSEWMGYFLLFEAMLDSVLVARDRWMAPNGIMAPSQTRILLAALDDEDLKDDRVHFWNDVYGFKMSAMKQTLENEAVVDFFKGESVISDIVTIKDLPLQTITSKQLDFVNRFELTITKEGTVNGFGGWFDTWFTRDGHAIPKTQKTEKVEGETFMTTGPFGLGTHWKQTAFILDEPIQVKVGTKITGVFTCHKGKENPRELECEIEYSVDGVSKVQNYHI